MVDDGEHFSRLTTGQKGFLPRGQNESARWQLTEALEPPSFVRNIQQYVSLLLW